MSGFPPPEGRPATMFPRPDPWVEQQRRDAKHRAAQRRRRRRWLVPLLVVVVLLLVSAATVAVLRGGSGRNTTRTTLNPATGQDTTATLAPEPTVPAEQLILVDEVWLIDRGDGVYDWGVTVVTPRFAPTRSGVVIDVTLLDADGMIVERAEGVVNGVDSESSGGVAGRLVAPDSTPIRIEFDVSVGSSSNDRALDEILAVRGLDRVGDHVRGRVRADSEAPVTNVSMLLAWRDGAGEIVATVIESIERIRPGVDARFEIDVAGLGVPAGRPDDVIWVS